MNCKEIKKNKLTSRHFFINQNALVILVLILKHHVFDFFRFHALVTAICAMMQADGQIYKNRRPVPDSLHVFPSEEAFQP
ncbi:MAG: hypothetical protein B6245_24185 [Desulfobacteraceae bacterium 4572_88]|nr:MAG: hypothetical protein B6245_24185 [Desulfobacteraceae bacterium 4572_88]